MSPRLVAEMLQFRQHLCPFPLGTQLDYLLQPPAGCGSETGPGLCDVGGSVCPVCRPARKLPHNPSYAHPLQGMEQAPEGRCVGPRVAVWSSSVVLDFE